MVLIEVGHKARDDRHALPCPHGHQISHDKSTLVQAASMIARAALRNLGLFIMRHLALQNIDSNFGLDILSGSRHDAYMNILLIQIRQASPYSSQ